MFIIIMGCGRVGARLAGMLSRTGHDVTILDMNPAAFVRLPAEFTGTTVLGNGIEQDVLVRAGIERADAFVAATQGDNRNIMASQLAKHLYGIENVVTRVYDPLRSDTYRDLGLRAISPTRIGADKFYEELTGESAASLGEA